MREKFDCVLTKGESVDTVAAMLTNYSKTMARLEKRIVSNNSSISNMYRTSTTDIHYIHRKLSELEAKGINLYSYIIHLSLIHI